MGARSGRAKRAQRVPLPTYAWNHKPYFIEPGSAQADPHADALAKIEDVERWGWRPVWKPALADPRPPEQRHCWLVLMDRAGVGRRLCDRLAARGDRVIRVYEGDGYRKRSADEYALAPERGKEGYAALMADLVAAGHAPDRIVHLSLLEAEERFRPGSSLYHHHQERGFFALFFLAQVIADEGVPTPIHITTVTNGMQRVGDEALPYPDKATVLGPAKVIPRELEGVSASVVDVTLPAKSERLFGDGLRMALADPFRGKRRMEQALDALADRLLDDLTSPPRSAAVARRGERRYEQVHEPVPSRRSRAVHPRCARAGST